MHFTDTANEVKELDIPCHCEEALADVAISTFVYGNEKIGVGYDRGRNV